jgi:hypothetical protein
MTMSASRPARRLNPLSPLALLLGLSLTAGAPAQPESRGVEAGPLHAHRALLIGISRYNPPCPAKPDCGNNLPGPQHDIPHLRQVLRERYGFADSDITVLQDADAVKPRVLAALADLAAWAAPGRDIFIYYSGHGTGPLNPEEHVPLPDQSGALVLAPLREGAPLTAQTFRQQLLVGRDEVRPLLLKMDRAGASVVAIIDACFSQNSLRSAAGLRERRYRGPAEPESVFAPPPVAQPARPAAPDTSWPYTHVAWLAASSANETADDLPGDKTFDGQAHGALTDALLGVLTGQVPSGDGLHALSYADLFDSTRSYMRSRHYAQTAQIMPSRLMGDTRAAQVLALPVFGWGVPGAPHGMAPGQRVVKVSLAGEATSLRSLLTPITGVEITDKDPEYLIKAPSGGPAGQWSFETGHDEPVLTTGQRDPLTQSTAQLRDSLAVRALMRRLASDAQARAAGLSLEVGSDDPTIGDTLHAGQKLTLRLRASRDVTVAVVHVMGDGQTHIWVPAAPEGVCMQHPEVKAGVPAQLCSWPSSAPPYGLDLLYIIAAEGHSAELAGITDQGLTPGAVQVLENVVAKHPGRVAIMELPLFTVEAM